MGRLGVPREVVSNGTIIVKNGQEMSDSLSLSQLPFILVSESRQTLPFSSDFLIAVSQIL